MPTITISDIAREVAKSFKEGALNTTRPTGSGDNTDAAAIIDTVEALGRAETIAITSPIGTLENGGIATEVVVLPKDKQIVSLKKYFDEYRTAPERRSGTATLTTEASFIAHVGRFGTRNTVIFADHSAAPRMSAIYDYNPAGEALDAAGFMRHRAVYAFPVSTEWDAWKENDEHEMDALTFAAFVEERLYDVLAVDREDEAFAGAFKVADKVSGTFATPTQLLELSRSIEISAAISVKQAQRLSSGELQVLYSEQHNDNEGKPIKIPTLFAIGIPVFKQGARYPIVCRLRYRLSGGRVTWWYSIVQPDAYFDDAVKDAVQRIAHEVEPHPVFDGAPEIQ